MEELEEQNFETLFLQNQNHLVLQKIFLYLDPKSLRNASLVNSRWHHYIHEEIWNRTSTSATLRKRLNRRWKEARPFVRTFETGDGSSKVFDIKTDSNEIVVSLENGSIEIWDKDTLTKRHSVEGRYTHGVHLGLHRNFIVTGFFDKKIDVWSRRHSKDGIKKVQTVTLDSNVYVVKVASDFVLASLVSGSVTTFKITENDKEPLQTHFTIEGSVRSAVRIDCHGDQLLSANHEKLLSLWNLNDGSLIRSVPFVDGRISRVRLYQPFGICLSWSPDLNNDRIILWNIDRMELLCRIDIGGSILAIGLNSSRIILHTSERKILHAQLENLDKTGEVKFERISGIVIGKCLESRECILEPDQVITSGSKFEEPGNVHLQNYWFGEFEDQISNRVQPNIYSPKYWFRCGFNFALETFRNSFNLILYLLGARTGWR